jgi:hypothetical protein
LLIVPLPPPSAQRQDRCNRLARWQYIKDGAVRMPGVQALARLQEEPKAAGGTDPKLATKGSPSLAGASAWRSLALVEIR